MNRPSGKSRLRGRRFSVRPAAPQPTPAPQPPPQEQPKAPRRKTILIVEDTAAFGGLLVALLREEGYRAMRAWDVREAERIARDRRPDLVLLDLALPYKDGVPVLQELREQPDMRHAPLLIVSGNTLILPQDARALVADVVSKPFDIDVLLNVVRRALGEPEQDLPERPSFDYGHEHAY